LDLLQGRVGLELIEKRGIEFGKRMEALRGGRGVRDVRSLGMMGGIEFHRDQAESGVSSESSRICKKILNDGVWLRPLGDVIPILPPVVFEDFEFLFSTLVKAMVL